MGSAATPANEAMSRVSRLLARNEPIVRIARTAAPIEFKKTLLDRKAAWSGLDLLEGQVGARTGAEPLNASDVPDLIAELDELCQKRVTTDAEFNDKKKQLLEAVQSMEEAQCPSSSQPRISRPRLR